MAFLIKETPIIFTFLVTGKQRNFGVLMRVNRFCYARLENIANTVIHSMRPMNSEVFSNLFPTSSYDPDISFATTGILAIRLKKIKEVTVYYSRRFLSILF